MSLQRVPIDSKYSFVRRNGMDFIVTNEMDDDTVSRWAENVTALVKSVPKHHGAAPVDCPCFWCHPEIAYPK